MAAQAEFCIVPFMKCRILAVLLQLKKKVILSYIEFLMLSFSVLVRQMPVLQNNLAEVFGSGEK
jgi:hypothetical protein